MFLVVVFPHSKSGPATSHTENNPEQLGGNHAHSVMGSVSCFAKVVVPVLFGWRTTRGSLDAGFPVEQASIDL